MKLLNDIELFKQIILAVSESTGIASGIIEKDYYVTLFLKELVRIQPNIVFKGGTSLSKCYKLINRFSEDLDLNIESDRRPSVSQKKQLKESILLVAEKHGLELKNLNEIRSRKDYNKYILTFPTVFESFALKQHLIVETSVFLRSFPTQIMHASSFIYDYLKKENRDDLIEKFDLYPFEVKVQCLERTFIEKLFAIGDYYLNGKIISNSRHLYDINKLYKEMEINGSLKELFNCVKQERSVRKSCLSAQDDVDLKELLQKIIDENVYKDDYNLITSELLFEKTSYEATIEVLQSIVNSELFY